MKRQNLLLCAAIFTLLAIYPAFGQQKTSVAWDKWKFLIGEWVAEGGGDEPGQGAGVFSFRLDLDNKILVRKSHSEYPATATKPKIVHDDLLIVYFDNSSAPNKAIYFDSEGHQINYSVAFPAENSVVLTSETAEKSPGFRLTYLQVGDKLSINFEIAPPDKPGAFSTYVKGTAHRN